MCNVYQVICLATDPESPNWSLRCQRKKEYEELRASGAKIRQLIESIWSREKAVITNPATAVAIVHTSSSQEGRAGGRVCVQSQIPSDRFRFDYEPPPHPPTDPLSFIHSGHLSTRLEIQLCASASKRWVFGGWRTSAAPLPYGLHGAFACYGNNMTS